MQGIKTQNFIKFYKRHFIYTVSNTYHRINETNTRLFINLNIILKPLNMCFLKVSRYICPKILNY